MISRWEACAALFCVLQYVPCAGKPRGRSEASERRCGCLEFTSDGMSTYDQREKFFVYDKELSMEGQGLVYQAHFNDALGYQRRMNMYIYQAGGQGFFIGNDLQSRTVAAAYVVDNAPTPELVEQPWNVLQVGDDGKAVWEQDGSVVFTCVADKLCRAKKVAHQSLRAEELAPTDACEDIQWFNEEKVDCLQKVIASTPAGYGRAAYQSKLAFVFRRQFNPSVAGNEDRMQECLQLWRDVIELMPANAEPWTKMGEAMVMTNQLAESEVALKTALSLRPPTHVRHEAYESLVKALQWQGRPAEAASLQDVGTRLGIFAAQDQRPATFLDHVPRRAVWADFKSEPQVDNWRDYPCLVKAMELFEEYYDGMRKEFLAWRSEKPEGSEDSHKDRFAFHDPQYGGWWEYFVWPPDPFGAFNTSDAPKSDVDDCNPRAPKLCELVKKLGVHDEPDKPSSDPENLQILNARYSIIGGNAHIRPHCGPANTKLTIHLPLVVPPEGARWRVANHTSTMVEREPIIFDDSFEHEVWNDGDTARVTLWIFFVNPALNSCGAHLHQDLASRLLSKSLASWTPSNSSAAARSIPKSRSKRKARRKQKLHSRRKQRKGTAAEMSARTRDSKKNRRRKKREL
mmetsp:Transcript_23673/g.54674  ORF Transcript_23673/g.54674 Transcript_23673/m.54674 type:complete len:628 (-) Transcript_23673:65-1948(-)